MIEHHHNDPPVHYQSITKGASDADTKQNYVKLLS